MASLGLCKLVTIAPLALALGCGPKLAGGRGPVVHVEEYHLAPRDEIKVTVLGAPELSVSQKVNANGTVMVPLVGDVSAAGLTEADLAHRVAERLADGYLKDPQVTVNVTAYGDSIYVTGQVSKPGAYPFQPNLTVIQALALAGGATPRASSRKTRVMRPDGRGAFQVVKIEPWSTLKPDDVLVVPERVF